MKIGGNEVSKSKDGREMCQFEEVKTIEEIDDMMDRLYEVLKSSIVGTKKVFVSVSVVSPLIPKKSIYLP